MPFLKLCATYIDVISMSLDAVVLQRAVCTKGRRAVANLMVDAIVHVFFMDAIVHVFF
jgi:hypothetical protein